MLRCIPSVSTPLTPSAARQLRVLTALAVIVTAALALGRPAPVAADWSWCWNDPTLVLPSTTVVHIDLGVPQGQQSLIRGSTLVVTVPANAKVILSGAHAGNNFPIALTLVQDPTITYSGSGPVPVTVAATINGPAGVPTGLRTWEPGGEPLAFVTSTTGKTMRASFIAD